MRLSDKLRTKRVIDNFRSNSSEITKLTEEISSGKKVIKPTDDPALYSKLVKYRDTEFFNSINIDNSESAIDNLELYENKIDNLNEVVKNLRQLVLEAGNSATFEQFRDEYITRLDSIMESALLVGNSKLKGEYMFSGSKTDTIPFEVVKDADGNISSIAYNGDNQSYKVSADESTDIEVDLTGRTLFMGKAGMGQDLFDEIISLRNDMQSGSAVENYDDHLNNIDNILQRVIDKRGEIGSNVEHLEMVGEFLTNFEYSLQEQSADIEGVDMAEAITNLMNYQNIYRASMEVASRMDSMSFLDYIR